MGLHLYCIVPAGHDVPLPSGIRGRTVRSFQTGRLGVWASEHGERPRPALETVRAHNAVVEAATDERVTPVPVRFGQWLESEDAVVAAVSEREDRYLELLEEFAGALEFGVRALEPDRERPASPRPQVASGRQYMTALAERARAAGAARRRGEEVAARLEQTLEPVVRRGRCEPLESRHGLFSAAYLVGRHDFGSFQTLMRTFRDRCPDLRFLISGPWPPYSFVE